MPIARLADHAPGVSAPDTSSVTSSVTSSATIETLAQEWRANATARLCATSATASIYALDHYLRYLAERSATPESASLGDISAYIEHCRAHCRDQTPRARPRRAEGALPPPTKHTPCFSMLSTRLSTLRSFYDLLVARGACATNPLRGRVNIDRMARGEPNIYKPQPSPQAPSSVWEPSREEIAALAAALDRTSARNRLLVALLLDTDLSVQRLCALRADAVAMRQHTMIITPAGGCAIRCSPVTAHLYRCFLRSRPALQSGDHDDTSDAPLLFSELHDRAARSSDASVVYQALRQIGMTAGVPRFGVRACRSARTRLRSALPTPHTSLAPSLEEQADDLMMRRADVDTPCDHLLRALFTAVADGESPRSLAEMSGDSRR